MRTKTSEARACGAEAEQSSYGRNELVIIRGSGSKLSASVRYN